jgi:type VI secretion system protein ImpL
MSDVRAGAPSEAPAREAAQLLEALKRSRGSQPRSSGELPWYILIGPSGAGKTSALAHSGLQFSESADRPVAGSSNVAAQYWFAEEAVLIDRGGREMASAGDSEADAASWRGYLQLLKRHRPRRPLNGVIAMVGLDALMGVGSEERRRLARAIRTQLRELDAVLKQRLPVYLVVTKIDRLAGFSSYFDALSPPAREQVWGFTLPLAEGEAPQTDLPDRFASAFDRLAERLDAMLPARLQEENDAQWRNQAFAFPREFALLAPVVLELLGEIALSSRLDRQPRLRGFYFTSALRSGASIDPLAQELSARFSADLPPLGPTQSRAGGLFLKRLFTDVVFLEENLVSAGQQSDPVRARARQIIAAVAATIVVALALFWVFAYPDQQRLLADAQKRLSAYRDAAHDISTRDVADADFARAERVLDQLRNPIEASPAYRWAGALAFDRSGRLLAAQNDLYGRALDCILLPRILVGLQHAMQSPQRKPQDEESDAKAYLMLGGQSPMDPNFARASLQALFNRLIPGAERQGLRQSLNDDAAALLRRPLAHVALDDVFAEDAKARIAAPVPP